MSWDDRLPHGDFPARKVLLAWLAVGAVLLASMAWRIFAGQFPDSASTPAGHGDAQIAASLIVPFAACGMAAAALARLAWRLIGTNAAIFTVLACGFIPALLVQLPPHRIDHAAWQIASVAIALWAIGWRNATGGGALAGLALAIALAIDPAIFPLGAGFAAVLALRWRRDPASRHWLASYLVALSLGLIAIYLAAHGHAAVNSCAAIAPALLASLATAALATLGLSRARPRGQAGLLAGFAAIGVLALGVFALTAPDCIAVPMANRWSQALALGGMGAQLGSRAIQIMVILQLALAVGATLALRKRTEEWKREWWSRYLVLLLAAIALCLLAPRTLALAATIAALPFGWLVAALWTGLRRSTGPTV